MNTFFCRTPPVAASGIYSFGIFLIINCRLRESDFVKSFCLDGNLHPVYQFRNRDREGSVTSTSTSNSMGGIHN